MHALFAFVDEYGDPSLDTAKAGVTDHFVVAAVMVQPNDLNPLAEAVDGVRSRHFQTGEMKSSGIGANWSRRDRILNDLIQLPFHCHILLVDKGEINKQSGLQYKRSFLKYIHGLLYSRLFSALPDLQVIADEHGSNPFMVGFAEYVRRRHIPTLFQAEAGIRFENSRAQPVIQLADILAGTIGHAARPGASRSVDAVLRQLADRVLTFADWPPRSRRYVPPTDGSSERDQIVRVHALNLASEFIRNTEGTEDQRERAQLEALRHLYFQSQFISEHRYVPTAELRQVLHESFGESMTVHYFRTNVIAPLRDAGVLLASSTKGYKIPVSEADIMSFVQHGHSIIGPLMARLNRARDELATASGGRLDILAAEDLQYLRKTRDT